MPIYMQYEGIMGPLKGKYLGWIELQSAQMGTTRSVRDPAGGNKPASAPSVSEIVVTKLQDSASTALFRESLQGTPKKVTIDFLKSDDMSAPYMSIELLETLISNYSISGHGGDSNAKPMESLALNSTKISYSAKPTSPPPGTPDKVTWDVAVDSGG